MCVAFIVRNSLLYQPLVVFGVKQNTQSPFIIKPCKHRLSWLSCRVKTIYLYHRLQESVTFTNSNDRYVYL